MLRRVVSEAQSDWEDRLPSEMAAHWTSQHECTGYSPNFLLLGELRAPIDLVLGGPGDKEYCHQVEFVEHIRVAQMESYELVRGAQNGR